VRLLLSRRQVSRVRILGAVLAAAVIGVPFAGAAAPPSPTITVMPPLLTNDTNATFEFTEDDPAATLACRLDSTNDGDFTDCTSPKTYTGLADATHTFDVRATNTDGVSTASYSWTIDTFTPPPTILGPPSFTNSTTASFTFTDDEQGVTFGCLLDDDHGFPPCPGSYSGLSPGPHVLQAIAKDALGNESARTPYSWTIDLTSPDTVIADHPPDPSGVGAASFAFTGSDAGGSGVAGFQCKLDGGGFEACSSPKNYALGDGSHTFQVRAIDAAGNLDPTPDSFTWKIDTVNPIVTLTDMPPAITNRTTASFAFLSNKPNSTFECARDGGGFADCTSPVLYTGLGDGSHTFAVRATAVTTGPPTTYTWTVDTVAPDTAITSSPPASSSSASANFTFTSSEAGSTFACSLDAGGITPCGSPTTYSGLGDGAHTFRVEAVDAAGNADATPATYSWQIAGVGPATKDTRPPGNVKRLKRKVGYGSLRLSWARPSDSDFDHVAVFVSTSAKSLPRTPVYKGRAGRYTNKRFKNGLYYRYAVVSYDHAGNASRGAGAVVPPSILLRSPRDGRRVHGPPLLVWNAVAKARFYNVQLYYGLQKVLSAWPNQPKRKLSRSWLYGGRQFQLRRGIYHWYVWPAFGPRAKARYGQLLGQSTFSVR
jgi:hypothetical protein